MRKPCSLPPRILSVLAFCLCAAVGVRGSHGHPLSEWGGSEGSDPKARALADSALAYSDVDPARCLRYAEAAAEVARRKGDRHTLHDALNAKRYVHYLRGEHELLLQTSVEALHVAQELHSERWMGDDHGWISVALMELRQSDKAYQHAQRALDHMRATHDSSAVARGLCDLSNACLPLDKHAEALLRISEAERIYKALNDTAGLAFSRNLMGGILMEQHRWNDALPVLLNAYRHIGAHGAEVERCWIERDISRTYAGLNMWNDAERFLVLAEGRAYQLKAVREYPSLLEVRMRLQQARGELDAALGTAQRLVHLNDSLLQAEVAGRIAALNAMHDVASKDDEVARLSTENLALQARVAKGNMLRYWWAVAFAVLALATWAGLRQHRFSRRAKRMIRQRNERIKVLGDQVHQQRLELEQQRLRLAESLMNEETKDVLLKEIHHRVKNNLQVVNALLKMQALHLGDARLDEAFSEAQGRVRSMALVHEHIYRVGDLSRVNVKAHVLALAEGILANHGLKDRVRLDLQVTYDKVSVEALIPLSLLLNELLTNTAKHAFHGVPGGTIHIALRRQADGACELTYGDDGPGIDQHQLFEGDTFGMELIRSLAEQLEGSIRLLKGEGTTFQLNFDPEFRRLKAAS
ncbi:MAG: sensor histidine kinase [Flavobacteriales bacterium]|nr:sensor histidine kinase [Flavobacteriales bacterium]